MTSMDRLKEIPTTFGIARSEMSFPDIFYTTWLSTVTTIQGQLSILVRETKSMRQTNGGLQVPLFATSLEMSNIASRRRQRWSMRLQLTTITDVIDDLIRTIHSTLNPPSQILKSVCIYMLERCSRVLSNTCIASAY